MLLHLLLERNGFSFGFLKILPAAFVAPAALLR